MAVLRERRYLLALDLGSKAGYCVVDLEELRIVARGTFAPRRAEGEGLGMRYLRFRHWLRETVIGDRGAPLDVELHYEEVKAHKGAQAAHVYGGFQSVVTSFCEEFGIPYGSVPVSTIKRHAAGKGNAPKAAVIAGVAGKFGLPDLTDDNEADAIALAWYVADRRQPGRGWEGAGDGS